MFEFNRPLSKLLKKVEYDINIMKNKEDLDQTLKIIREFNGKTDYSNTFLYIVTGLVGLGVVVLAYLHYTRAHIEFLPTFVIFLFGIGLLSQAYQSKRKKAHRIYQLSQTLLNQSILFSNHLSKIPVNGKQQAKALSEKFNDFNRGGFAPEIELYGQGHYKGPNYDFDYFYYRFKYVEKDGQGVINFYRYGIITTFPFYNTIYALTAPTLTSISPPKTLKKWTTASISFNQIFREVLVGSEIEAAKFFSPRTVILFEEVANFFTYLNFEITPDGQLCLSVEDKDFFSAGSQLRYTISQFQKFEDTLKYHDNKMKKLEKALYFIHSVMQYSDNKIFETTTDKE